MNTQLSFKTLLILSFNTLLIFGVYNTRIVAQCEKANLQSEENSLTKRAEEYFFASNQHDLAKISSQISEEIEYVSTGVGSFNGKKDVLDMMSSFFTKFPNVSWKIINDPASINSSVVLRFEMRLHPNDAPITGTEVLTFADDGQIVRITVIRDSETNL